MINIAKKVKCPECGTMNEKEDTIFFKKRYYCKQCYEKKKETVQKNTDGWDSLYQYMKYLYEKVNIKMITQISKYRKKPYNFTNTGMELTLYYYHELLDKPHDEEAIGLIPYYYDKAKNEYINNRDIQQYNEEVKFNPIIQRIKVKPEKKQINIKLIDIKKLD